MIFPITQMANACQISHKGKYVLEGFFFSLIACVSDHSSSFMEDSGHSPAHCCCHKDLGSEEHEFYLSKVSGTRRKGKAGQQAHSK